ncbi:MAG: hypothetical protein HOK21_25095 [Rhodospirillaceae bacterium]|nr:hypothetical protein [Rhodospirillaceae bacterium]MBT4042392.1 hypothetical protein [Rhodospirillaceae bacterium]MBT5081761.1 hypothetical protein [Rhodospirillaceae bacterium]MBT5527377.1 hypothetical protein [Rhodospirillaceae bacterium]MBT5881755.1 hypothetical protein [Rhodospirillaceae bacterium]
MFKARQILLGIPVLLGLGLAVWSTHDGGDLTAPDGKVAAVLHHTQHDHGAPVKVNREQSHDRAHDHGDLDHCQDKAGHCAPAAPAMAVDMAGPGAKLTIPLVLWIHDDLTLGLDPLPAVPPPEVV